MNMLLNLLNDIPEYRQACQELQQNKSVALNDIGQICRSHIIAGLYRSTNRPIAVICQDDAYASRLQNELNAFLSEEVPVLPARELALYDSTGMSKSWEQKRLNLFWKLSHRQIKLIILTWESMSQRTIPADILNDYPFSMHLGMQISQESLVQNLNDLGYSRCPMVEGPGQYAIRGGIIDIYSPSAENPVRIEFFGDEIDTLGFFDPVSQRRVSNLDSIDILPVSEVQPTLHRGSVQGLRADIQKLIQSLRRRKNPNEALIQTLTKDLEKLENLSTGFCTDRYMALIYPEFANALDHLPADGIVVLADHANIKRTARTSVEQTGLQLDSYLQSGQAVGELCDYFSQWEDFCHQLRKKTVFYLDTFTGSVYPEECPPKSMLTISAKQLPGYAGSIETAAQDLSHYQKIGFSSIVLCGSRRRAELMQEMLQQQGIHASIAIPCQQKPQYAQIYLTDLSLPCGMEYTNQKIAILSEGQLISKTAPRKVKKTVTNRQKLNSFTDLSPGDLVVHDNYGIGRFISMEQIRIDGAVKDYVKIAYHGTDTLYVPATQLDLVSKYIGGAEDATVRLNKIGTDTWQKTKAKARKAAKDMAAELIQLYAARKRQQGFAFAADTPWQLEFEGNFPYPETDDQLRCIQEIKQDMEAPMPMDRLLCGDVGFGKTEVALRAIMKAIMDGKQAAILVPTTVLAQQHYQTAVSRFRGFPVNIDVLSRFRSAAQQKKTLENLRIGQVDLIIGTHKLLQKSIQFKDLGLLIIDEEQRFGVSHKERLKEITKGVDVLTLSATPIPRTLNMALSGIRDMSTIEIPPADRFPVQTFVVEHSTAILDNAISREIARGGQVYYLHNRVETIDQCAASIKRRNPDIQVAVAHGKMSEDALSEVMQALADGQVQVLVCTTIIETGLDIPNVNTLIIENADRFGLSQLHQLRGRVGRSTRRAYAYLTFRPDKALTEVAEKRLSAIRDFAEFGSGFKIAMRDLEIRGAGNLLGSEQSGHMMSVGYDMYLKLLDEAVLEEKGESPTRPDCTADLNVTANVDKNYVTRGEERMDLYRRMAAIRSQEDADDLLDEIIDRYGDPPKGVINLINIALLRENARAVCVTDIRQKNSELYFIMHTLHLESITKLCADPGYKNRIQFIASAKQPTVRLRLASGSDSLRQAKVFIQKLQQFYQNS